MSDARFDFHDAVSRDMYIACFHHKELEQKKVS